MLAIKSYLWHFVEIKNTKQIAHYDYSNYEGNNTSVNKIG